MVKNLFKIIFKVIGAILIVGILIWALSCTHFGKVSDFAREVCNTVEEFFNPSQAVRDVTEKVISSQTEKVAEELGVDVTVVEALVEKLHIEGLEVIALPDSPVERKTLDYTIANTDVTVTIYRDPGYISIAYEGHFVTVSVPEKAQKFISLL